MNAECVAGEGGLCATEIAFYSQWNAITHVMTTFLIILMQTDRALICLFVKKIRNINNENTFNGQRPRLITRTKRHPFPTIFLIEEQAKTNHAI